MWAVCRRRSNGASNGASNWARFIRLGSDSWENPAACSPRRASRLALRHPAAGDRGRIPHSAARLWLGVVHRRNLGRRPSENWTVDRDRCSRPAEALACSQRQRAATLRTRVCRSSCPELRSPAPLRCFRGAPDAPSVTRIPRLPSTGGARSRPPGDSGATSARGWSLALWPMPSDLSCSSVFDPIRAVRTPGRQSAESTGSKKRLVSDSNRLDSPELRESRLDTLAFVAQATPKPIASGRPRLL